MAHAVADEPKHVHMGLPLPHGKLAMWLFLVTEIMFFSGMFFCYTLYRYKFPLEFASASNHLSSIRIERIADELTRTFTEQRKNVSWLQ